MARPTGSKQERMQPASRSNRKWRTQAEPQTNVARPKRDQRTESERKNASNLVGDQSVGTTHPFLRWQTLMKELQHDISFNFLSAIRDAITDSTTIAAKAFVLWHLSGLPECREYVAREMRQGVRGGTYGQTITRFIYFLFWRINADERRVANPLRLRIVSVVEYLDNLVFTNEWTVPPNVSISAVLTKISDLGGIAVIYGKAKDQLSAIKIAETHRRVEDLAERQGITLNEALERDREHRARHQQQRDEKIESKFLAMLPNITEELLWTENERVRLIVEVRTGTRTQRFKLQPSYKRRMTICAVNPTTRIT